MMPSNAGPASIKDTDPDIQQFARMYQNNPENYHDMLKAVGKSRRMYEKSLYNSMVDGEKVVYNIKWSIRKIKKYFENESSFGHKLISKISSTYVFVKSNKIVLFSSISLAACSVYVFVSGDASQYIDNSTKFL